MTQVLEAPTETAAAPEMSAHIRAYINALSGEQQLYASAFWKLTATDHPEFDESEVHAGNRIPEAERKRIRDVLRDLIEQDAARAAGIAPTNSLAEPENEATESTPESEKVGSRDVDPLARLKYLEEQDARLRKQRETVRDVQGDVDDATETLKALKKSLERETDILLAIIDEHQSPLLPFGETKPTTGETPIPPREPLKWVEDAQGRAWSAANTAYDDGQGNFHRFAINITDDPEPLYSLANTPDILLEQFSSIAAIGGFASLDEAKAFAQDVDNKNHAEAVEKQADPVPADDAWRSVTLEELNITKPRVVKALTEREPALTTLGAIADHSAAHGDFWMDDIKGVGKAAAQEITDAIDKYWDAHPRK